MVQAHLFGMCMCHNVWLNKKFDLYIYILKNIRSKLIQRLKLNEETVTPCITLHCIGRCEFVSFYLQLFLIHSWMRHLNISLHSSLSIGHKEYGYREWLNSVFVFVYIYIGSWKTRIRQTHRIFYGIEMKTTIVTRTQDVFSAWERNLIFACYRWFALSHNGHSLHFLLLLKKNHANGYQISVSANVIRIIYSKNQFKCMKNVNLSQKPYNQKVNGSKNLMKYLYCASV